jgi:uncharacterized peroxidase-related enzyme
MTRLPFLPPRATLLDVFKAYPETNRPLIEYHEALLRGPSPFSEMERELIAAYVSGLNGCRYCHATHAATAELLGAPAGLISRLIDNSDLAEAPENLRPVLRYAFKLTRDPRGTTPEDAKAVLKAGWGETGLYHVVAVTALFNFMNRLVEGLGIEFNPDYAPGAAKRLVDGGYRQFLDMIGASVK